ncbi:MAG TPA: hypothetical protein VFU05_17425 [Cyclobacteriaceae bacterium]|nr:hypothetical protein [Cyclobacteriaceae bacterium]
MKTLKGAWVVIFGLVVAGCNDDEMKSTNKLSSEEQAEMVAASVGKSGFAASADQSADYADDAVDASGKTAECGYNADNSVSLSGTFGEIIFSFAYDYAVSLVCTSSDEPKTLTSEFTYEGSFDGPKFATEYSGNGSLAVTSLEAASANYHINGTYERAGSFETKIEEQSSGSSNIMIDIDEVIISKSTKAIVSGSADASVSGVVAGKGNYAFDAHIVFNGDGTATITVSGDHYIMNLATGQVTIQAS